MPEPTWETVAPLAQDVDARGRAVTVRFVCPRSGHAVQARAQAPQQATSALTRQMKATVTRSLLYSLRRTVANVVRSLFGRGMVGRVLGDLASSAMHEAQRSATRRTSGQALSQSEREAALVAAFVSVQSAFVWHPDGGWVAAVAARELLGAFQRRLAEHPVVHPYDRQVLARMLVEVARADGQIAAEESSWLTELLTADQGSVQDLLARPPLTAAELGHTSPGPVRETLLMLAHALAFVDEHLDPREAGALRAFGQGLGLSAHQQAQVADDARTWVLDQAFDRMNTWGGHDPHARAQLYALAGRLGLDQQQAEQAEARFLRRTAR